MNRTGLFIALVIGICGGVLFGIFPQLDLTLARMFYDGTAHRFVLLPTGGAQFVRRAAMWIAWAFVWPVVVAPIVKLIWPNKPLLASGRTILFLSVTIFLSALIFPNAILKEHWGRARPIVTQDFGGGHAFTAWWDPRGTNRHNGSFYSGEAATAFWTYAPAALAPPSLRPLAYAAATIFGLTIGILRMAFGGHYASDIIAAGVATFVIVWIVHRYVFCSARLRTFDQAFENGLTDLATRIRTTQLGWLLVAIGALTALRLVALRFSIVDLFPDESRYWAWARTPAFGYFSKPPLIAWIIGLVTQICGNAEGSVRAASPILYGSTAIVCYALARSVYGERAGFWSGLCLATATGVVFSARIISTDVALVFFWAVALLAYVKLIDAPSTRWAVVLGMALGLGLLAKYAMVYFLLGALVAGRIDQRSRVLWRRRELWIAFAIAAALIAPNLIWNLTHGFATFTHTRSNVFGGGFKFDLLNPLAFLGAQFGVCGPILFTVFLIALVRPSIFPPERGDRLMLAFALPPLVLVIIAAIFTSVKANWAAPSAIAAIVLAAAVLVRRNARGWLIASVILGLVLQLTLAIADSVADRVRVPFLANPDIYHRTMGWKNIAEQIRRAADANGARAIASDHGDLLPSLVYYLRDDPRPILAWPAEDWPTGQFDLDRPITASAPEPVLLVTDRCLPGRLAEFYGSVETNTPVIAMTSRTAGRAFCVFKLAHPLGKIAPIKPSPH